MLNSFKPSFKYLMLLTMQCTYVYHIEREDIMKFPMLHYFTTLLVGRVQIVKFLLKKLSLESITRISKNSDTGWSVLHEAASRDQSSILQVLFHLLYSFTSSFFSV